MNAQVFGHGTKIRALNFDLTKLYYNEYIYANISGEKPSRKIDDERFIERPRLDTLAFLEELRSYKKVAHQLNIPSTYDLIMCNPPWIPASKLPQVNPLDNGVYDPDEKFLKSALNFARLHLSPNRVGRMLLVYSDLAKIIGLQNEEHVENLIRKAGLFIEEIYEVKMGESKRIFDPLKNYKAEAKVQLYEIYKS